MNKKEQEVRWGKEEKKKGKEKKRKKKKWEEKKERKIITKDSSRVHCPTSTRLAWVSMVS